MSLSTVKTDSGLYVYLTPFLQSFMSATSLPKPTVKREGLKANPLSSNIDLDFTGLNACSNSKLVLKCAVQNLSHRCSLNNGGRP